MPPKRKAVTKAESSKKKKEEVESSDEEMENNNFSSMTVVQLRNELTKRGLSTKGLKSELISRLSNPSEESSDPMEEEEKEEKKEVKKLEPARKSSRAAAANAKDFIEEQNEEDGKDEEEDDEASATANYEDEGEGPLIERVLKRKGKTTSAKGANGLVWHELDTLFFLDSPQIKPSDKIIGFDMDGTLIEPKSGAKFPKSRGDWVWLYPETVVKKLKELNKDGYKVVIFTNQGGIEKKNQKASDILGKIIDLSEELGFPIQAFVASATDVYRKPNSTMWDYMVANMNGGVKLDLTKCAYVGDAAGRPKGWRSGKSKDFSCGDRTFAHNIGIDFKTPEEFFLGESPVAFEWGGIDPNVALQKYIKGTEVKESDFGITGKQELVLLVGCPASGKSTLARRYFVPKGYVHVNMDTLKSKAKCIKVAREGLESGKSVVVDNTNPGASTRAEYTSIADELGIPYRCFVMDTDIELAHHLNFVREKTVGVRRIPDVGYNMFKKNFQVPTTKEGFSEVKKMVFYPKFDSDLLKKYFLQRTC